jgi:hypothetical protein
MSLRQAFHLMQKIHKGQARIGDKELIENGRVDGNRVKVKTELSKTTELPQLEERPVRFNSSSDQKDLNPSGISLE